MLLQHFSFSKMCLSVNLAVLGLGCRTLDLRSLLRHAGHTEHGRLRPGALSAAERSYPMSEVRGSGRERQAATAQERLRGATQV